MLPKKSIDQNENDPSKDSGNDIVQKCAPSSRQLAIGPTDRSWFNDVKETEQDKRSENEFPIAAHKAEWNCLAQNLINDDTSIIMGIPKRFRAIDDQPGKQSQQDQEYRLRHPIGPLPSFGEILAESIKEYSNRNAC